MTMRTEGTLTKWNEAQASGYLVPAGGGDEVFVQKASMPSDGLRPRNGETFSYEVETDGHGKPRAVRVWRVGDRASASAAIRQRHAGARRSKALVMWMLVAAAAAAAYVLLGR